MTQKNPSNLVQAFLASSSQEAAILVAQLKGIGIEAHVFDDYVDKGLGTSLGSTYPSSLVLDETLELSDFLVDRFPKDGDESSQVIATDSGVTVLLNTKLTSDLVAEGLSREIVNRIQRLRKQSGLQVCDRIVLEIIGPIEVSTAIEKHKEYISQETLATSLMIQNHLGEPGKGKSNFGEIFDIEGLKTYIGLSIVK